MSDPYNPEWVRQHFDAYADGEWQRLTQNLLAASRIRARRFAKPQAAEAG